MVVRFEPRSVLVLAFLRRGGRVIVWVTVKRAREQGGPRRACEPKKEKKRKL